MTNGTHETRTAQSVSTPPALVAWHITERGEKKHWQRVGAAWSHGDGEGLTLRLDLIPATGGRIVLRKPKDAKPS